MRNRFLMSVALVFLLAGGPLAAQTVVLSPVRDGTLFQDPGGLLANGSGSSFFCGLNNNLMARRAILAFDVAGSIPPWALICSAELHLDVIAGGATPIPIDVHRVTANWGEGASVAGGAQGGGAPSLAGDATWIHAFYPASLWASAGGDFVAAPSASTVVGGLGTWSLTGLAADVQQMLNLPASNHGWVLRSPETLAGTVKNFAARESATAAVRPRLAITYVSPVPALAVSLGGGCLGSGFSFSSIGVPVLGNAAFTVSLSGGPPGSSALIYLSTGAAASPLPIAGGCLVMLDLAGVAAHVAAGSSPIGPLVLDASGGALLQAAVPADPCLVGWQVALQAGASDPAAPGGLALSTGLLLQVGL
jgi:hypothetical protein